MKCELNCGKTCQGELKKCCKHNNILSKSNGISFIVLSNQEYFEVDISILVCDCFENCYFCKVLYGSQ